MTDGDELAPTFEPRDLQWAALAILDAWFDHDELALAGLTAEQRQAQLVARRVLFDFVDDYREAAKDHAEHAVFHAPEWQVVAGMKDLLGQMLATAEAACSCDEPDADEDQRPADW
jgi:hypothetical protein